MSRTLHGTFQQIQGEDHRQPNVPFQAVDERVRHARWFDGRAYSTDLVDTDVCKEWTNSEHVTLTVHAPGISEPTSNNTWTRPVSMRRLKFVHRADIEDW